jgi:hypothetical protein
MKKPGIALCLLLTVFSGGTLPSPSQRTGIQTELAGLAKRGITYRMIDNQTIELTDAVNGTTRVKSLESVDASAIRLWAAKREIPILEVNPATIDTSRFRGWFNRWVSVPLGNSTGVPLVCGDIDHNGCAEIYGAYLDTTSTEIRARAYEVDSIGNVRILAQYDPRPGISRLITDVNQNSLLEVDWTLGSFFSGYEQSSVDTIPQVLLFSHEDYYRGHQFALTGIYVGNLDGDDSIDYLYTGTGPDPADSNLARAMTYVAEFQQDTRSFDRVWQGQFVPGIAAYGYGVGDFDNDGIMEFEGSHAFSGKIFVVKNTSDNQYSVVWQDSTPFVNLEYHGSGDVDNDGKMEFFVGATMSDGNWILMYEADSVNSYSARFLFHLISGGVFAEPTYTTSDIDNDGRLELEMMVSGDLYVFKSNADNEYYLWYFQRVTGADAATFYDVTRDRLQEIIVSQFEVNTQGRGWLFASIYQASPLVVVSNVAPTPVSATLEQNYPNPFNPSTTISYEIPSRSHVTIKIVNLLGEEVATLVDGEVNAGKHSEVWNAVGMASGVYFCRMQANDIVLTQKVLLVR